MNCHHKEFLKLKFRASAPTLGEQRNCGLCVVCGLVNENRLISKFGCDVIGYNIHVVLLFTNVFC